MNDGSKQFLEYTTTLICNLENRQNKGTKVAMI